MRIAQARAPFFRISFASWLSLPRLFGLLHVSPPSIASVAIPRQHAVKRASMELFSVNIVEMSLHRSRTLTETA
jgi:hypothetical protein